MGWGCKWNAKFIHWKSATARVWTTALFGVFILLVQCQAQLRGLCCFLPGSPVSTSFPCHTGCFYPSSCSTQVANSLSVPGDTKFPLRLSGDTMFLWMCLLIQGFLWVCLLIQCLWLSNPHLQSFCPTAFMNPGFSVLPNLRKLYIWRPCNCCSMLFQGPPL